MSNSTNAKLTDSKILKLNMESIKKVFYIALFYFIVSCIFEFWRIWESSFIIIPFLCFYNSLESLLRDKNLLYRIKQGFQRELSYYLVSTIISLLIVFPVVFVLVGLGVDKLNYYRLLVAFIISFIPVSIAFLGYKSGKI